VVLVLVNCLVVLSSRGSGSVILNAVIRISQVYRHPELFEEKREDLIQLCEIATRPNERSQ